MTYKQSPPFALQVELTEGCNLRCPYCGISGIRSKSSQFKFMDVALVNRIIALLKQDSWSPRIEFAMHGEPSLNPHMVQILGLFRRKLPKTTHLMMTSNGAGFIENVGLIDASLEYLNVLGIEDYEHTNLADRLMKQYKGNHQPTFYPADPSGNPHRRRKTDEHDLVLIQDIAEATSGTHHSLNNHCGCGAPRNEDAVGLRCAKPFREMSIRWDGNVSLCCNDWRGYFKLGNVLEYPLEELWQAPAMMAARRKLYRGQRDFVPCAGCDARSYRVGLLPDKQGKRTLSEATEQDKQALRKAVHGRPYTSPVLRPWEAQE